MDQNFSINIEVSRDLMRVTLGGFFEVAKLASVSEQLRRAKAQLRCAPNQHVALIDVRGMSIQPQDSISTFERIIREPGLVARKLAFVVPHTLLRTQVKRAASSRDAAYFDSVEAAEHWLFGA